MAEVFLARRRAAGVEKWLVVKRIRAERAGDARFLDLFVREARLSMSLAHQNIVPVFDFGRIDDQVFLAMERVEGRDLGSSLAKAGKPLPPLLAAFIATECLQALDYAHRRRGPDGAPLGIVHRDVTPRNVLLSWSGEVKLTDFGIAALAGDDASAHKMIGTPAYMAPEQARGEALDPRADVYSVGMVLREALTGVRARAGEDREAIVAAAKRAELVAWPDGFESPLKAVCEKATAAAAADRYADAREMLDVLDEFIVGERAAGKEERRSPARQIGAWLEDVWKNEREKEDAAAASGEIVADHLVSFMDDGELDVMGTGTARSLAATASEVVPAAAPQPAAAPAATTDQPAASSDNKLAASAGETPGAKKRGNKAWWIAGAAAVAAAAAGAVAVVTTSGTTAPPAAAASAEPPVSVRPVEAPPAAEHVTNNVRNGSADPPPLSPPPDASAVHVGSGSAKPHNASVAKHPQTPQKTSVPAPPVALYKVTLNIAPWAYATIDGDPTPHQTPASLELSAGIHKVHFVNPEIHQQKDITIDVPDHNGFTWAGRFQD